MAKKHYLVENSHIRLPCSAFKQTVFLIEIKAVVQSHRTTAHLQFFLFSYILVL